MEELKNPCHATASNIWKIFHGRLYIYKNTKVGGNYFYKNVFGHIVPYDHTFVSTTFLLFQAFHSAAFLLGLIFCVIVRQIPIVLTAIQNKKLPLSIS